MLRDELTESTIQSLFSSVNVERAEAKVQQDRDAILELIRLQGVPQVNQVVLDLLKEWYLQVADKALAMYETSNDNRALASIVLGRSNVLFANGETEGALEERKRGLELYLKCGPEVCERKEIATVKNNIAQCYFEIGDYAAAEPLFREVLQTRMECLGPYHSLTVGSMQWISLLLRRSKGRYQEAQAMLHEALSYSRKIYEDDTAHTEETTSGLALTLSSLGGCLLELERPAEALVLFEESLSVYTQVNGLEHVDVASTKSNIGLTLNALQRPKEGLDMFRDALRIDSKFLPPHHPRIITLRNNVAGGLYYTGRKEEALVEHLQILEMRRAIYRDLPAGHPDLAVTLYWISAILKDLNRTDEAAKYGVEALRVMERTFGNDHPTTIKTRKVWGQAMADEDESQAGRT